MTPGLMRGQNVPLPDPAVAVRITCAAPAVPVVLAVEPGAASRATAAGLPALPGVSFERPGTGQYGVLLDPAAGPAQAYVVALALSPASVTRRFGAVSPAPQAVVSDAGGTAVATFTLTGLGAETAVAVVEVYRRNGGWRLRAVGQGYADGLRGLLADHGVPDAPDRAGTLLRTPAGEAAGPEDGTIRHENGDPDGANAPHDDAAPEAPYAPHDDAAPQSFTMDTDVAGAGAGAGAAGGPFAGDAPGWSTQERLVTQVAGMREDLARRIAAYRSAADFARTRLERELDGLLADPARRLGAGAEAARAAATGRHDELTDRARAVLDHDLRQLAAESAVVEPALPPACADWASAAWRGFRPPKEAPIAVRLGDVHLPEVPELRLPLLTRLPLPFGLWVDCGTGYGALTPQDAGQAVLRSADMTAALVVRLLACRPPGGLTVHGIDPDGLLGAAFAPLTRAGLVHWWTDVTEALEDAVHHADLARMGGSAGQGVGGPGRLVVVGGLGGAGDRAVALLRYLADEGPAAGVLPLVAADPADGRRFGPVLDPLWRSLLRLTPLPDDHLADPWVGHAWTFEPSLPPEGDRVLDRVIGALAGGARFTEGA